MIWLLKVDKFRVIAKYHGKFNGGLLNRQLRCLAEEIPKHKFLKAEEYFQGVPLLTCPALILNVIYLLFTTVLAAQLNRYLV